MDLIDSFLKLEYENKFFDLKIEGYPFWWQIRRDVYLKIENLNYIRPTASIVKIKKCTFIRNIIMAKLKFYFSHKSECDVLFISHPRRVKVDEYFKCLYTDDIAQEVRSSATLEFINRENFYYPPASNKIYYFSLVNIFTVFSRFRRPSTSEYSQCAKMINSALHESLGLSIGTDLLERMIFEACITTKSNVGSLRKFLKKLKPKVIVETVSYGKTRFALNMAAKELNIPVVELQHGVIGKGHIGYNFYDKISAPFFPDCILLFSDYWENARFPIVKLTVTGYPYQEANIHAFPKQKNQENMIRIIVLSQPEFSKRIFELTCDLVNLLDNDQKDYSLVYKLHPSEYNSTDTKWDILRSHSKVTLVENNSASLYEWLSKSDIQVGVTSTALFEGLAYGLKTFIYHIEKTDSYMGDLCTMRYAKFFESAEELATIIAAHDCFSAISKSDFFVTNAKENILRELSTYY